MTLRPETLESESYKELCESIRAEGRKKYGSQGYSRVVFANGVFDLLHLGHLSLLNECRILAGPNGAVVVGVNSDASVKRIKGPNRPILDEVTRCSTLIFMKPVDHVLTFDEDTPLELVEVLRPDVIVKGSEYRNKKVVGSHLAVVTYVDSKEGISTTQLIERIRNG